MAKGKLYLIPTPIGDRPVWDVLPASNRTVIDSIDYFIVEDIRSARRFLSKAGISRPIDSLRFAELNEHTAPAEVSALFAPLLTGTDASFPKRDYRVWLTRGPTRSHWRTYTASKWFRW